MASLHVGDDSLERRVIAALAPVAVLVAHVDLRLVSLQDRLLRDRAERLPRVVEGEAQLVAESRQQPLEVVTDVPARPRPDRTFGEGHARVAHDELGIDLHARAEAGALRTGAEGRVERERPGLELFERQVVVEAGEVLGEHALSMRVALGQVDEVESDQPG